MIFLYSQLGEDLVVTSKAYNTCTCAPAQASSTYALPVRSASFPSLETLHIIHCGALRHVFEQDEAKEHRSSVEFPKLATIHLHDLPALQQICEAAEMPVPKLETIRIRGCWSLRRLPALKGREPGMRRPAVEVEWRRRCGTGWTPATTLPSTRPPCTRATTRRGACSGAPSSGILLNC